MFIRQKKTNESIIEESKELNVFFYMATMAAFRNFQLFIS